MSHLTYLKQSCGYSERDRCLQSVAYTFIASVPEMFAPLLVGGRVVAAAHSLKNLDSLHSTLRGASISRAQFVPAVLAAYLEGGRTLPSSLSSIIVTGEAFPSTLVQRLTAATDATILNH